MSPRIRTHVASHRFIVVYVVLASAALIATNSAKALDLFSSGTKTWDNTTQNWGSVSGGPYNTSIWNSATPDDAIFEGTAGTVSVAASGVTARDIDFNTSGYLIQNNTLTLAGGTSTITTGPGITATISSIIDGSSPIRKEGSGTLFLNAGGSLPNGPGFPGAKNIFTGAFTLAEGTVQLNSQAQNGLGTGSLTIEDGTGIVVSGNNIHTLNNSQYNLNGDFSVTRLSVANTLNFSTGNATLGADVTATVGAGISLNIDNIVGDGGGNFGITKDGASNLSLLNPANTYTGKTVILNGTLRARQLNDAGVASSLGAATGADSVIDIHNGAALRVGRFDAPGNPDLNTTNRVINLAGAGPGTVTVFIGNGSGFGQENDTELVLNSNITATGTGAKTLAFSVNAGQNGSGDRSGMTINGAIPNVSDGSPLTLQITVEGSQQTKGVALNGINTYTGDTTVRSGGGNTSSAGLILGDNAGLLFEIGASGVNNQIRGLNFQNVASGPGSNIVQLNGDFTFDLSGASDELGDIWNIVDVATLTENFGATFTVNGFTDLGGGLWELDYGAATYTFSQSTGLLSVTAVLPVPEPASFLLGLMGLISLLVFIKMRKRNR